MAFVQYQSPDDTAFLVFDASRFRVDHALFLLKVDPLRARISEKLEERRDWDLRAMKLVEETRRLESCREWLDTLGDDPDVVALPELKHEPAIDLVADALIGDGEFDRAYCTACEKEYGAGLIDVEAWRFEEGEFAVRGRRSICPQGHTIHAVTDEIEAPDLESPDDWAPSL